MKNISHISNKKALSIIEIMVAIFIFAVGISGVYMIVSSTMSVNMYNKNYIIASNLAREQIELIRNVRDTNYAKLQKWNTLNPDSGNYEEVFKSSADSGFYKLENRYDAGAEFPIKTSTGSVISDFTAELVNNNEGVIAPYQLCLDSAGRYVYCTLGGPDLEKTRFYRYIDIQEIVGGGSAYKINSWVFWREKGVHSTNHPTILADWKRL